MSHGIHDSRPGAEHGTMLRVGALDAVSEVSDTKHDDVPSDDLLLRLVPFDVVERF